MKEIKLPLEKQILINPVNFFEQNNRIWIDGTDALFATENLGFGGFSNAYVWELYRLIHPSEDPQFISLHNINLAQITHSPVCISTPITREADAAQQLMTNILNQSVQSKFKKIRLCQLVRLNSKQEDIFFAIVTSICSFLIKGLPKEFPTAIIFDVEESHSEALYNTLNTAVKKLNG